MADRRPNKKAASEDEVGEIHMMTTKLHNLRLKHMLQLIADGANVEDVLGNGKALAAAGKWAADQNNITTAAPELDEESQLGKHLALIKKATGTDNVVKFDDSED